MMLVAQMRSDAYLCIMRNEQEIGRRLITVLEEVMSLPVTVEPAPRRDTEDRYRPDMEISAGPYRFIVEVKSAGTTNQIAMAANQLLELAGPRKKAWIPLVVVPFMSAGGKLLARERGLSWVDLSGNAWVIAPGLRVIIEGKPNQFIRRGRPRDLFAPRSVRITRALLLDPSRVQTQAELSKVTGLNRGTVSRIVSGLVAENLVERVTGGASELASAVRVVNAGLLMGAWRDAADFGKQDIHRYSVAARDAVALTRQVARLLADGPSEPVATGLAAAWLHAPYADFRLVTFYVRQLPSPNALRELGARSEPKGANLWLTIPKDEGVRMGEVRIEGVACASAVQTYIDLKGHPERASDAANALRETRLHWANGSTGPGAPLRPGDEGD